MREKKSSMNGTPLHQRGGIEADLRGGEPQTRAVAASVAARVSRFRRSDSCASTPDTAASKVVALVGTGPRAPSD